jgi:CubicO group peptidase (beta-lactamase class C family)
MMMRCIWLLALLTACSQKPDFNSKVDQYFSQILPNGEPGGAVLVMKDSDVVFSKGYGLADLKTKEAITTKTLFNLGSISKTFVSNGILMLQKQGKLSVEDSLVKYFPGFKNKDIARKVKIKHLLTHTSGLPDNRQVARDSVFYLTAKDAENWYPITQTDTLEFEPGTRFHYSNPAFNALALIIEQVTGEKWQDYIKKTILLPSGMVTTTITDGEHPSSGVSHAYTMIQRQWREDDYGEEPTFCAAGNGGVWSSVEEMRLYELALRKGTFLDKASIDESATVKTFPGWSGDKPPAIGWSWFIGQTPDSLKTIGHTGSQGGFQANYVSIPEKKILFVVLCNAPRDLDAATLQVLAWMKDATYFEGKKQK